MPDTKLLPFRITTRGTDRELELVLHDHTRSPAHVGDLVTLLLDGVAGYVDGPREVSDGDVIQSLTLAAAAHLAAAGVPAHTARALLEELVELALDSAPAEDGSPQRRH